MAEAISLKTTLKIVSSTFCFAKTPHSDESSLSPSLRGNGKGRTAEAIYPKTNLKIASSTFYAENSFAMTNRPRARHCEAKEVLRWPKQSMPKQN